jgi:hypothetical protein
LIGLQNGTDQDIFLNSSEAPLLRGADEEVPVKAALLAVSFVRKPVLLPLR